MSRSILLKDKGFSLKEVVMCSPVTEYFLVDDKLKHNITENADKKGAIAQHKKLVRLIEKSGVRVLLIKELPGHPNSVFAKDTAVSTPRGFIKLRMGIRSRIGEETWMRDYLRGKKVPEFASITKPGTAEGGDVVFAGQVAFVGISSRTNKHGALQMKDLLERNGFEVRTFKVPHPFLHLGGAMSFIGENTILCVEKIFPINFFAGFKTVVIPNNGFVSGNVITLNNKRLIVSDNNLIAIQKLKKAGFEIFKCCLSEFIKGTGGPSCLIMPTFRK